MSWRAYETDLFRCTGNVSGNFIFTWILNDFSKRDDSRGRRYDSQCIHTGASKYESWYLRLYPGGEKDGCKGVVSLYLRSHVDYEEKMKLRFVIELRNSDEKIIISRTRECNDFCMAWGYQKLIARRLLISELIDDVLVIHVKATYTLSFVTGMDGKTEEYPEMNSELICNDMRRMHVQKIGTDVVISVGGVDIPAHYAVLAARSKVFAAMFEHDTIEKSTRRVSIDDFDADSVKSLIQFIYTGSLDSLTIDLAMDMLRAADKYGMDDLMIYCSNYLISRFDIDNIGKVAVVADAYNASKLRGEAIRFICKFMSELDFEKYASELTIRGRLLLDIIKCMSKRVL